jgi:hypothetical protein
VKVKQSLDRPLGFEGFEAAGFQDNRYMDTTNLSDPCTEHFYLNLYSFILKAESNPVQ